MLPFLINMADLFEKFVAEWLRAHLPEDFRLKTQEHVHIDEATGLFLKPDLTLYDRTGSLSCVLVFLSTEE